MHPNFRYQFPECVNKNNAKNTRVLPIQASLLCNSNLDHLKKIKYLVIVNRISK